MGKQQEQPQTNRPGVSAAAVVGRQASHAGSRQEPIWKKPKGKKGMLLTCQNRVAIATCMGMVGGPLSLETTRWFMQHHYCTATAQVCPVCHAATCIYDTLQE